MDELNYDFRDLIAIDRRVYKHPVNPAYIWKLLGTKFSRRRWSDLLSRLRVKIVAVVMRDYTDVEAYFDSEQNIIEIGIVWDGKDVENLKFQVIQTILHEYVHAMQFNIHEELYYKTIAGTGDDEQDYLRYFGEIQAYAHCMVLDCVMPQYCSQTILRFEDEPPPVRKELMRQFDRWCKRYEKAGILNFS